MNKKDVDSKRENNIYNAIRKVTLEGCDAEPLTKSNDQNRTAIGEYSGSDDDRDFEYGPMDNFYQIAYTSPLFSVNTYVARDVGDEPDNSFFDSLYPNNPNKAELLAEINNINFKNGLLEEPLSNLTKSNMSFLYQEYKEKM
ncbi:hypothetical protein FACS1894166_05200 [Bacilli bacterium]|nr:hypothetical protein FACS1894166_05200 [Bacilli bacterium]